MENKAGTVKLTPHGRAVAESLREKRRAREEMEKQGIKVEDEPWYQGYLSDTIE